MLKRTDPFAGEGPGFNHAAAHQVYDTIMRLDDDEAAVFATMVIGQAFGYDQDRYEQPIRDEIGKRLERLEPIKARIVKAYVAKRAAGEDVAVLLSAAEQISKAFDYTPEQLRQKAMRQHRDLATGRFVREHRKVDYAYDKKGNRLPSVPNKMAEKYGIPNPKMRISEEQRSEYQQAYRQVASLIGNHQHNADRAFLHLQYPGQDESIQPLPSKDNLQLAPDMRLLHAAVSVLPGHSDDEHSSAYDTLNALDYQYGQDDERGLAHFNTLHSQLASGAAHQPASGLFARMRAASTFLDSTFRGEDGASVLPVKAQAALKAGHIVGTYGPEAAKVLGPPADRAAYRYRGTERATPDRRLAFAVDSVLRDPRVGPETKRDVLVRGTDTELGWQPSTLLRYFRALLPKADLNTLQLKSGTVPPSQGVVLDRAGKAVTQAVGYGDDWYLPFNLKHLAKLKGGEYVRTRTWGGPTTEDIYTGLMSGAKSLTVVSHNGVYNIEFDPSFTGGRRFNDKATRMINRYGHLLDAVRSGQVTTGGIDPTRIAELEAQAERSYDRDAQSDEFKNELRRLMIAEQRNPTFSAAQKAESAQRFLDAEALNHRTPDGHEMTRDELINDWLTRKAAAEVEEGRGAELGAYHNGPPATVAGVKGELARTYGLSGTDDAKIAGNAVTAMGLGEKYTKFLERDEQTYRAGLQPLALNGKGYQLALDALQEQFPYYISRVQFRPWTDARNAVDSGYVKPKANRPAEALSGYFDSATGRTKAFADSTRHQAAEVRAYKTPAERLADSQQKISGPRGQTGASPSLLNSSDARELRNRADLKMLEHLRGQTRFSNGMAFKGDLANLNVVGGKALGEMPSGDMLKAAPALHAVLNGDRSQLEKDPDKLHQDLVKAIGEIRDNKILDLDPEILKGFENDGRASAPAKFNMNEINDNLRHLDEDRDFAGKAYHDSQEPSHEEIQQAYADLDRAALGLPEQIGASDFDAKADAALRGLKEINERRIKNAENPFGARQVVGAKELPRNIEQLARAKQLRRSYLAAEARAKQAAAVPAGSFGFGQGGNVQIQILGPSGEPIAPAGGNDLEAMFHAPSIGDGQRNGRLRPMM